MFGYFALGVVLGLLFGAVIAAIVVLVIVKCCDKGKMAPYYMVRCSFTQLQIEIFLNK